MNYRYFKKVSTGEIICGVGDYIGTEEVVDITKDVNELNKEL
jgi:hypothetical protein